MTSSLESALRAGWYLAWQQQSYRIVSVDLNALSINVEQLSTLETRVFRLEELLLQQEPASGPPVFAPTLPALTAQLAAPSGGTLVTAADLPAALLQRAEDIIQVVERVEQWVAQDKQRALRDKASFKRTTAIEQALSHLYPPLAVSTFYKYRQLYTSYQGNRAPLAAALRRSDFNQTRMSEPQLHFTDTLILRYYARSQPIRPMTLYRIARSALDRTRGYWVDPERCGRTVPPELIDELLDHRLPIEALLNNPEKAACLTPIRLPSRSWLYQYLRWFKAQPDQGRTVVTARHGLAFWEHEQMVFDTFVTRASAPLQYVFADHWLLDVFIVDETTRSRVNRLWFTALIDAYSRSILGMALLYEPPSIHSIQQALYHAIWPKTSHREKGLDGDWSCFGIPLQLYLDNAWAHHSLSLEDLSRAVACGGQFNAIDLVFRPPYKGRYGALIERFFGNLSAQCKEVLPGAIFSDSPRHRQQAARQACWLYQDVDRFLHQLILRYQHTPHSELQGMTPHEKWLEGMGFGLPLVPPLTSEMERLFWRLEPDSRLITRKGIGAFGMHYWSPELDRLTRVDLEGQPVKYHFRYDPTDLSRLALFREGRWAGDVFAKQLRQPDGTYLKVSLAERDLAQDLARRQGEPAADWLRFIQEVEHLSQARLKEQRQARRSSTLHLPVASPPRQVEERLAQVLDDFDADYTTLLAQFTDGPHDVSGA